MNFGLDKIPNDGAEARKRGQRRRIAWRVKFQGEGGADGRALAEINEPAFSDDPFGAAATDIDNQHRLRADQRIARHPMENVIRLLLARNELDTQACVEPK